VFETGRQRHAVAPPHHARCVAEFPAGSRLRVRGSSHVLEAPFRAALPRSCRAAVQRSARQCGRPASSQYSSAPLRGKEGQRQAAQRQFFRKRARTADRSSRRWACLALRRRQAARAGRQPRPHERVPWGPSHPCRHADARVAVAAKKEAPPPGLIQEIISIEYRDMVVRRAAEGQAR